MKINLNDFSKPGLVDILSATRSKGILPDNVLAELLRLDLITRVRSALKKVERLGPRIDAAYAELTPRSPQKKVDAYNRLVDRYNRLNTSGNGMLEKIRAIEKAWPELKAAGRKSGDNKK